MAWTPKDVNARQWFLDQNEGSGEPYHNELVDGVPILRPLEEAGSIRAPRQMRGYDFDDATTIARFQTPWVASGAEWTWLALIDPDRDATQGLAHSTPDDTRWRIQGSNNAIRARFPETTNRDFDIIDVGFPPAGELYWACVTRRAGVMYAWLNDFQSPTTYSDDPVTPQFDEIAGRAGSPDYAGVVAGFYLYDFPFTQADIDQVVASGFAIDGFSRGYHMEEEDGRILYDSGSDGVDADMIGGTLETIHILAPTRTYSWANEVGHTNSAGIIIPRNESQPDQDAAGGDLQHPGQTSLPATVKTPVWTGDGTAARVDFAVNSHPSAWNDYAIFAWVNIAATDEYIYVCDNNASEKSYILRYLQQNERLEVQAYLTGTGVNFVTANSSLPRNSGWTFVGWRNNNQGSNPTFFINDQVIDVAAQATNGGQNASSVIPRIAYQRGLVSATRIKDLVGYSVGSSGATPTNEQVNELRLTGNIAALIPHMSLPLTEGDGRTVFDVSGNDRHGSIIGGTLSNIWANKTDQVRDHAVQFGGRNNIAFTGGEGAQRRVEVPYTWAGTAFSVCLWFRTESNASNPCMFAFESNGTRKYFQLRVEETSGLLQATMSGANVYGPKVDDGVLRHVAATFDGAGNLALYVNGSLVDSDTGGAPSGVDTPASFAASLRGPGQYLTGDLFDGILFTRELNAGEVSDIYAGTIPNDAIANYPMDDGVGSTTIRDISGNNNTATLNGLGVPDNAWTFVPGNIDGSGAIKQLAKQHGNPFSRLIYDRWGSSELAPLNLPAESPPGELLRNVAPIETKFRSEQSDAAIGTELLWLSPTTSPNDYGTTTISDNSGNGRDGTLTNSTYVDDEGRAIYCDGADAYVQSTGHTFLVEEVAWCGWFRKTGGGTNEGVKYWDSNGRQILLFFETGVNSYRPHFVCDYRNAGGDLFATRTDWISDPTNGLNWHHVIAFASLGSTSESDITLVVDGVEYPSVVGAQIGPLVLSEGLVQLGSRHIGFASNMLFDDFRVLSAMPNAGQIAQLVGNRGGRLPFPDGDNRFFNVESGLSGADLDSAIVYINRTADVVPGEGVGTSDGSATVVGVGYVDESPVNITPPVVTGTAEVNTILSSSTGTWTGDRINYFYQWQEGDAADGSDMVNIPGETTANMVVDVAHLGKYIRCVVTASNSGGSSNEPSNIVGPAFQIRDGVGSSDGSSTVAGVGQTTVSGVGTSDGSSVVAGVGSFTQIIEGVGSSGGLATVIAFAAVDGVGTGLSQGVATVSAAGASKGSAIGSSNGSATVSGIASDVVAPVNDVPPLVTGEAKVGEVLSTTDGEWTAAPAPTFTYQWQRGIPTTDYGIFDGVDDRVECPVRLRFVATMGVRYRAPPEGASPGGNIEGSQGFIGFTTALQGGFYAYVQNPRSEWFNNAGAFYDWQFAMFGWNGAEEKCFFENVKQAVLSNGSAPGVPANRHLGGTANHPKMEIAEAWWFDEYLTDQEILDLFADGTSVTRGLLAHYDFSDGSGTQITDLSGNGNHGTLLGDDGSNFWGSEPTALAYENIVGATEPTYQLTDNEVGRLVRCVVTATNSGGSTDAGSNEVGPVTKVVTAVGSSDGSSTANATGASSAKSSGQSDGSATVIATSSFTAIVRAVGLSEGSSFAIAFSEAEGIGFGRSDGRATVIASGAAKIISVGTSDGSSSVFGVGVVGSYTTGISNGVATVVAIPALYSAGVGISNGVAYVVGRPDVIPADMISVKDGSLTVAQSNAKLSVAKSTATLTTF